MLAATNTEVIILMLNIIFKGLKELRIRSTGCLSRGVSFDAQHPCGGTQLFLTVSNNSDALFLPPEALGTHVVPRHARKLKTYIHRIIIKNVKSVNVQSNPFRLFKGILYKGNIQDSYKAMKRCLNSFKM